MNPVVQALTSASPLDLLQEEKQRKLLKVRIGVAKFLQETISESGLKANEVVKSDEFKQFFRKASFGLRLRAACSVVR